MRFGRGHAAKSKALELPERSETVTFVPSTGERLPARVLESGPDRLLLALMVPTEPLSRGELEGTVLEFNGANGRIRLTGTASVENPSEPDVLRIERPRSIEVLQQREFVRIAVARPALVYVGPSRMEVQSYTVDISGGGFMLAGPDWLKLGDEIEFLLTLTPGVLLISGKGKVVRIDDRGRRAIAFLEVSELDRRRLVRFIFECQRTELARGLEPDYGD
jgi:PilZ domain